MAFHHHLRLVILLGAVLGSSSIPSAHAQEADSTRTYALDPIVVTGTRVPLERSRVAGAVSVITREELAASGVANVLPVAAERAPGVFVQERGTVGFGVAPGSGGGLSIRGLSGAPNTQTLVLIDGQPQYMGLFGHPIADAYHATDVERVEVWRGPASVLYGTNALGGAINLVTRVPPPGRAGTVRVAGGSYGTGLAAATGSVAGARGGLFGSVNAQRTGGVRPEREDGFRLVSGSLKGTRRLRPGWRLSADATLADARFHDPGPLTTAAPPPNARRDYLRGRAAAGVEHAGARLEGALKLYLSGGRHAFSDGFDSRDYIAGMTLYESLRLPVGGLLTAGLDARQVGGRAETQAPAGPLVLVEGARVREVEPYVLVRQPLGPAEATAGVRRVWSSVYGSAWVPAAGLAVRATPTTTLRASAAAGFRSPALVDLFIGLVANEALEPERVRSLEAGLTQVLGRGLLVEVAAFRMRADELIRVVPTPGGPPRRQNTGALTSRGFEVAAEVGPGQPTGALIAYVFLDPSEPLPLAPRHDVSAHARLAAGRWHARLSTRHVRDLYLQVAPEPLRETYTLLGLRLSYRLRSSFQLFAEAENVLDEAYQIDAGYPMPGRTLLVGAALEL